MFISSVSSIIPGDNNNFGQLYPTSKILDRIRSTDDFDVDFIEKNVGIETIALSNDTISYIEGRTKGVPRNNSIYQMLDSTVDYLINQSAEKDPSLNIKFHIHITSGTDPWIINKINKILLAKNIDTKVKTLILQQGCSGILEAIDLAERLIGEDEDILITAENNTIPHSHQRFNKFAHRKNMNEWLWASIFGEAVGGMIVSKKNTANSFQIIEKNKFVACNEWRVTEKVENNQSKVVVKAKEVKKTYITSMSKIVNKAHEEHGLFSKYLFHESNPKMIQYLRKFFNINSRKNVSISSKVGTLACVSSFTLLDRINYEKASRGFNKVSDKDKILLAAIGETGGSVIAGHMVLRNS